MPNPIAFEKGCELFCNKLRSPRNDRSSWMLRGSGARTIASILSGSACRPSASILWPKYSTEFWESAHLSSFENRSAVDVQTLFPDSADDRFQSFPSLKCHLSNRLREEYPEAQCPSASGTRQGQRRHRMVVGCSGTIHGEC